MSWIGRVMSTIGFNGIRVDTLLEQEQHHPGETLHAQVKIDGGRNDSRIDAIKFSVWTQATNQTPVQIAHCTLAEQLTIAANSELFIPVKLALPSFTPLSVGGVKTWLQTELDVPMAPDPQDTDAIEIVAIEQQQQVFAAMSELCFTLTHTELEPLPQQSRYQVPFLQQFYFESGKDCNYAGILQLAWEPDRNGVELLVTQQMPLGQNLNHRLDIREPVQPRLVAQLNQLLEANPAV
ncbi:sporulation protein [Ferrimonas lipolytica]|uniref:Sporulation protein n=1 Tax=Ferrimonas lipolytica TaxID=2724191 RepID=A0A6H1UEV3_9GAMM|nr:sporulation protein [Ferrimonas lipolytica]QIZ77159.1 sporulation protein [Ferrimonas lipolytica]